MRRSCSRPRRLLALFAFMLALMAFPLAGTAGAEQQTPTFDPVSFEFTTDERTEFGYEWVDDAGYHWRDTVYTGTATGDATGAAVTLLSGDFKANPDCPNPTCDGDWSRGVLRMWGTLSVTDDTGWWAGQFGYNLDPDGTQLGMIFLIGHGGYGGQAISGALTAPGAITYEVDAERLTMSGPTGGISIIFDACIPRPAYVDGGFILSTGELSDSGSVTATYPLAQQDGASFGEVVMTGEQGTLNAVLLLQAQGVHRIGYFMLLGGDGAYEGMYGFGWVRTSRWENPNCPSGQGVGGAWIGETVAR